jgi:hypothetical protein
LVVVLWSYNRRWTEIFQNEKFEDYGPWSDDKNVLDFLLMSNEFDQDVTFNKQIYLAQSHLNSKGIPNIHIKIKKEEYNQMSWCPVKIEDYDFGLRSDYPRALDGGHPGEEAHNAFSKLVINSIDNCNLF